jgi:hypothetical protein
MRDSPQAHDGPHNPGSHYQPALSVVSIIVVLFVAATFLMLRSSSPSLSASTTSTSPLSPLATTTTAHSASTVLPKSKVRVQVANGTSTTGLARTYTQRLLTLGWDTLPQMNGPKVTSTVIYFNPGFKWSAKEIANELHASAKSVQAYNGQILISGASTDDVIVILGPDLAITG